MLYHDWHSDDYFLDSSGTHSSITMMMMRKKKSFPGGGSSPIANINLTNKNVMLVSNYSQKKNYCLYESCGKQSLRLGYYDITQTTLVPRSRILVLCPSILINLCTHLAVYGPDMGSLAAAGFASPRSKPAAAQILDIELLVYCMHNGSLS